ncbi:MAG: Cytochrome c553 [Glomeribacter sp. 1016415]|uniref:Periplasmic cytochrome type-C oxidoreductase protein n=1 Tax=Mycoavidus cysteinexigens TaxID=1553431 RepID=A0A2Z6ETM0_9BURK|nr:cytochrome c [Mycoavidus cysteinexigens]MCX8565584.1 Cytochrome c553 [Glomeribacter sp. 1016415]BBE08774.1 periplasmic cytochrome type-C oxidoreductase protein [Mycoavidus cysteinexigens]GAM52512.1 cytochrome c553 [bacterium endosymbiont of Mortierella elongata FMR23-6]GLR01596.1 cytochrome c [Mycoavidus cysteinexigens]
MKKNLTMAALAVFLSATASAVETEVEVTGNAKAGESKVAMCIGCHGIAGYRTAFPEVYRVPMLGGQNAKYIQVALQGYKNGDRKYSTMHALAASLSDQDMADIAEYYAAQKSSSPNNPDK